MKFEQAGGGGGGALPTIPPPSVTNAMLAGRVWDCNHRIAPSFLMYFFLSFFVSSLLRFFLASFMRITTTRKTITDSIFNDYINT